MGSRKILNLLARFHKNILVVGDDAQSIYAFRAATIDNILSFEKEYSGAKYFVWRRTIDLVRRFFRLPMT